MTMRDAEEDEETRVLSPREATAALPQSDRPRQAALPPPRIPRPELKDAGDDETTKLKAPAGPVRSASWLISEGPNAPRELDHEQLTREIKAGKLSRDVFAWRDGMKQWQSIAEIPSLAGLLGKPANQSSPAPNARASAPLLRLGPLTATGEDAAASHKVLMSSSVSTADFSRVDRPVASSHSEGTDKTPPGGSVPPRAPPPKPATSSNSERAPASNAAPTTPAAASSRPESMPRPAPEQLIEAEVDAQAEAAVQEAERASPTPRPAAGRPPNPYEPVAKADAQRVMPRTPAIVIADEAAHGTIRPKISHREVTQPARSRLTLAQLRAGSQRPNVLLWVLGAGGWAVAGVLAGVLMANRGEPAAQPAPGLEPATTSVRATAQSEPIARPASPQAEPTAAEPREAEAEARSDTMLTEQLPTAAPAPVLAPRPKTTLSSNIATPQLPSPPNLVTTPTARATEPVPAPSAEDAINSPGF